MMTTQREIRAAFWSEHPALRAQAIARRVLSKGQNAQIADTRMAFCDFVEVLARSGEISDELAGRVTL